MAEYIEREEAIKMLIEWREQRSDNLADLFHWTGIKAMLENVPPADVKPVVRGKWEPGDIRNVSAVCSNCGYLRLGNGAEWATKIALFCERCGADMRTEEDDS